MSEDVDQAAQVLRGGGVIAYATEAVFGLGCDPQNRHAIEKLLQLKRRPAHKGLILIAANERQLHPYLQLAAITPATWAKVRASWPGPVTWLLPAAPQVSSWLRGEHDTLAVRVSAHAQVCALCEAFDGPLVSTSANRSDQAPAKQLDEVIAEFDGEIDLVLVGETGGADKPSEIRDGRTGKIIRAG
ncbi:MAG: Sua5/YciO/YrdC/YwlC family protein [Gammaproteobacteria bacterium]